MTSTEFRKELLKKMPGLKWVVRRTSSISRMCAVGSRSSGFNRVFTLTVTRREENEMVMYTAASFGFGRAPWLSEYPDRTLAKALRGLQNHNEAMASEYGKHASYMEEARVKDD